MQAQSHFSLPQPDYYISVQGVYSSIPLDQALAPEDGQNFTNCFSRGSSFSYPHQDHRYSLDRGELASRLCSTSLVGNIGDATGGGFAGNPSPTTRFAVAPEDIPAYHQPTWGWTGAPSAGIIAPAPVYPQPLEPDYFGVKSPGNNQTSIVRSPAAQLPTPAAMAVLLNPNGRSEEEPSSQSGFEIPPGSTVHSSHGNTSSRHVTRPVESAVATQGVSELSREKKHACTMCHKRFDRPSTLRKHLLVHTGEKAFVCDTCGRRFGVASNLNRHVKRCILKPVNTPSPSNKSVSGSPPIATDSPESSTLNSSVRSSMAPKESSIAAPSSSAGPKPGKRARERSPPTHGPSPASTSPNAQPTSTSSTSTSSKSKNSGPKRRRRAPSPSQWIPVTLQNFNFLSDDSFRVTTIPLSPVRRNPPREERDSWDENVHTAPYHPCGWSGVLPGPGLGNHLGLGGRDVRNLNLGGRGGFMLGRVLVF